MLCCDHDDCHNRSLTLVNIVANLSVFLLGATQCPLGRMNSANALFLHGGPGLHAAIERIWFGNALPVHWWDQPTLSNVLPFQTLVSHATQELQTLSNSVGGPIDLIAHSYGARIAAALASEHPTLIRCITLLGVVSTKPCQPFITLGQRLLEAGYDRPGLAEAMLAAEKTSDADRFVALIQGCFPEPSLPDIYFSPNSAVARDRYLTLASTAPPIDVPTFIAVMLEALATPPPGRVDAFAGEVRVLLGKQDPVLRIDDSTETWRGIFPQARFEVVDAGHFIHLELPPDTWLHR